MLPKTSTAPSVPSDQPLVRPLFRSKRSTARRQGGLASCCCGAWAGAAIRCGLFVTQLGAGWDRPCAESARKCCEAGRRTSPGGGRTCRTAGARCSQPLAAGRPGRRGLAAGRERDGSGGAVEKAMEEQGRDSRCSLVTKSGRREGGEGGGAARAARGKIQAGTHVAPRGRRAY